MIISESSMFIPKVSVIVPNYNHAPYLRLRLDSIFNQTFQDFEIIILDDCSTDNSKEVIEEYRNRPQVSHVLYNKTNSGSPFKQWAKGFDLAKGEYIWLAESDDWSELNFLEEMIPILKEHKDISYAFCNSYIEDGTSNPPLSRDSFSVTKKINGKEMINSHLRWRCNVYNASSVLFRKESLFSISKEYQSYTSSGDYLFWILLSEVGNVFYNYQILNHHRIHNTNISIQCNKSGQAYIEDFSIYKYLQKNNYYSFYEKHVIILERISIIRSRLKSSPNDKKIMYAYSLYKKEIFSEILSKVFVKAILFFWKFFQKQ